MRPAAEQLARRLEGIAIDIPQIPVIHNVDVDSHSDATDIQRCLVEQLYSPVRWTETVERLAGEGVTQLLECGPGKVLSSLNRRIDKSLQSYSLEVPDSLQAAAEELN